MKRLLLVYNADSNFIAWVGDFITKILRPAKYPCHLCMLTFGWFSMFPHVQETGGPPTLTWAAERMEVRPPLDGAGSSLLS